MKGVKIMKKVRILIFSFISVLILSISQISQAQEITMVSTYSGYYTTSHYIKNLSYLSGYGSNLASQSEANLASNPSIIFLNQVVILDFGRPAVQTQRVKKNKLSTYGTLLFDNRTVASTNEIAISVKQFIDSFIISFQSNTVYSLTIGVGTSNYGSYVTNAHGQAWGNMINSINAYISDKAKTDPRYNSIKAVGANDMETGWNTPGVTRAWVQGYRSATNYQLCDYGDAGGMPQAPAGTSSCIYGAGNNGWTLDDKWYVSDGGVNTNTQKSYSFSLPEIYTKSGTQAAQWFNLDLYSHEKYGKNLDIYGVMTDYAADLTRNTPESGWNQLAGYINSSTVTKGDLTSGNSFMQWSTDISWGLP